MPTYHAIILAKNEGTCQSVQLVSVTSEYFNRPSVSEELDCQNTGRTSVGSACEAGELYQAILNEPEEENSQDW